MANVAAAADVVCAHTYALSAALAPRRLSVDAARDPLTSTCSPFTAAATAAAVVCSCVGPDGEESGKAVHAHGGVVALGKYGGRGRSIDAAAAMASAHCRTAAQAALWRLPRCEGSEERCQTWGHSPDGLHARRFEKTWLSIGHTKVLSFALRKANLPSSVQGL